RFGCCPAPRRKLKRSRRTDMAHFLVAAAAVLAISMAPDQSAPTQVTRTGDTEIPVSSPIAAAPAGWFPALTAPDLVRKGMSADGREMVEVTIDLRPQGRFRFVF